MFRKDIGQVNKHLKTYVLLELLCQIFNIPVAPSKFTRHGVRLPEETVFAAPHVGRNPETDPKNHEISDVL